MTKIIGANTKEEYTLAFHNVVETIATELTKIWNRYAWIRSLEFTVDTFLADPDKPPFSHERKEVNELLDSLDENQVPQLGRSDWLYLADKT